MSAPRTEGPQSGCFRVRGVRIPKKEVLEARRQAMLQRALRDGRRRISINESTIAISGIEGKISR